MGNHNLQIPAITRQEFFAMWGDIWKDVQEDENEIYQFFEPVIKSLPKLALGEHYWQIFNNAQPLPQILFANGAVSKLTPVDSEELVGLDPETFFSYYHPNDLEQVMTFMTYIFPLIMNLPKEKRNCINFTVYTRVRNKEGQYFWNSLQYPALYFDKNDNFMFGMAVYTNIHHLMKVDAEPMMTILDSTNSDQQFFTLYTSQHTQGIKKDYIYFSQREREVIALISQGKASKQIADILGISQNTVNNHRQRILKKLGVHSSTEMLMKALHYI